jgi:hypothetical protein
MMMNAGPFRRRSLIVAELGASLGSDLFGSKEYAQTVGERLESKQGYQSTSIVGEFA